MSEEENRINTIVGQANQAFTSQERTTADTVWEELT